MAVISGAYRVHECKVIVSMTRDRGNQLERVGRERSKATKGLRIKERRKCTRKEDHKGSYEND